MWFPSTATTDLEESVAEVGHVQLLGPPGDSGPPEPNELDTWQWDQHRLESDVAAKLGFGIASTEAGVRTRTLVAEFSRTKTVGEGRRQARWGVAARLVVTVIGVKADANLTLPFVAAEAQFNRVEASASLKVEGYAGDDLGEVLPAFSAFDVETYVKLLDALTTLKGMIAKDPGKISPTRLWVWAEEREGADTKLSRAVAVAWALTRMGEGDRLERALADYRDQDDPVARDAIEDTYRDLNVSPEQDPGDAVRERARVLLDRYQLKGRLFA